MHALIKKVVERVCASAVISTIYTVKPRLRFLLIPVGDRGYSKQMR
jgi:hypothetical protein